mgnify:CR=1 FL=1|jgi:hypothetical protein
MLTDGKITALAPSLLSSKNNSQPAQLNTLPLSYFDLLDETPEFSEAAILLEDETIEYCYIKLADDGSQYFGFNYALPSAPEYNEILSRHKLLKKMEANTFERYPSGKTVLSRGGKILEINLPKQEASYV